MTDTEILYGSLQKHCLLAQHSQRYSPTVYISITIKENLVLRIHSDIYSLFEGRRGIRHDEDWHLDHAGKINIIVVNATDHSRMRRTSAHVFSDLALREQESLMTTYFEQLITKLKEKIDRSAADIKKEKQVHMAYTIAKVEARLRKNTDRKEFISYILGNNKNDMSHDKIEGTATVMIMTGSEITASALCVATYYMLKHPKVLSAATSEVRKKFKSVNDINMLSVRDPV
ncbi:hypothetical protein EAF00_004969 [Botryotinia globosa]|nr:hypothetical protein EAF00_004969 [Botryotinia globosa]